MINLLSDTRKVKDVGLKYKEKLENLTGLFKMCVNLVKLDETPPFPLFFYVCTGAMLYVCLKGLWLLVQLNLLGYSFHYVLIVRNILKYLKKLNNKSA